MKSLYESIHDTDIEANVKFPIYITYVLGHGIFKTEEYQVVYNAEQAEDIVAELHAQGFNASYDTVFADEDWDFDKDADETDYGAEWDAEATERFENRYMDGGNGATFNEDEKTLIPSEFLKRDYEKLLKDPMIGAKEHWSDAYEDEVRDYGIVYSDYGLRCPKCGSGKYSTIDDDEDDYSIRYHHECWDCGYVGDTGEIDKDDLEESDKYNSVLKEELGRNVPPIPFENTDDGYYFFDDHPDATDEDFRKAREEYNKETGYEEELSNWYKREYGKSIEEIEAEHEAERKSMEEILNAEKKVFIPNEYLKRDWEKLQKEPLIWAKEHWSDAYTKEVEEYGKSLNESSQDDFDKLVDDIYEFYKQWDPYSLDVDEEVDKASIRKALSDPDEDMDVMSNIQEILKDAGDENMDFKELGDSIIRRMRVDDSIDNLDESEEVQDMSDEELRELCKKEIRTGRLNKRTLRKAFTKNEIPDILGEFLGNGVIIDEDIRISPKGYKELKGSGLSKIIDYLWGEDLRAVCMVLGIRPE